MPHPSKGNGYICVIGEVTDYYDVKDITAFDVPQVSSGNELTHHFLEVAYLFEKMMEYIRSAKQDDIYGASNIILPCPGS